MLQNIDIHTLHQLMNENENAQQIISQLFKNHQRILSSVTHEIRNPLTLISSSLQLMEVQHPEVKTFRGWEQLIEDVDFIRLLLNELSSFNNGHSLHYSVFSMESLLKNISLSFAMATELEQPEIEFTSCIPSSIGNFSGDEMKLKEVFLNLLRNAKEAVGNAGTIRLSAARQEHWINIQIQDSGCGIPQEQLQRIFEPFVTYKPNGTGLGLAISKKIVEAHHGTITVTSEVGKGSIFFLQLPI